MANRHPLSRAAGISLGVLADRVFADPRRCHPVAGFGSLAAALESAVYPREAGPSRARLVGAAYVATLVGGAVGLGAVIDLLGCGPARAGASSSQARNVPTGILRLTAPVASAGGTALATWVCLGGTSLLRVAAGIGDSLAADDLASARERLPWLCGRDPEQLDAAEMARAVVESLAENTSDAHVAPVFWAAVAGVPGVLAYRAANTLDAMVGHRNERYTDFGWTAARLDDLLNLVPARLAGVATVALAAAAGHGSGDESGGSAAAALAAWRRDAAGHPSPNAGVVEASAAGALGVRLGGRTPYPYRTEWRAELNPRGRDVEVADIARAARLERRVQDAVSAAAVAAVLLWAGARRWRV